MVQNVIFKFGYWCVGMSLKSLFFKTIHIYIYIQGVSRLLDITAGGDFLGLFYQKSSYKHVSDFERLWSYDRLKFRIEGNDY